MISQCLLKAGCIYIQTATGIYMD